MTRAAQEELRSAVARRCAGKLYGAQIVVYLEKKWCVRHALDECKMFSSAGGCWINKFTGSIVKSHGYASANSSCFVPVPIYS